MKISIHQPSYWPWLGLLHKIAQSDTFVILDNVEISKGSFQYRNQFLCNGITKFITLPVEYHSKTKLSELKFKDNGWADKQLSFIRSYYNRSAHFNEIYSIVEQLFNGYNSSDACGFINKTMIQCFDFFDISVDVIKASEYPFNKNKGELVYEICNYFQANIYISGQGAKAYMNNDLLNKFAQNGIQIEWQKFKHPKYPQGNQATSFVEGLSSLDLLFHNGIKNSRKIMRSII